MNVKMLPVNLPRPRRVFGKELLKVTPTYQLFGFDIAQGNSFVVGPLNTFELIELMQGTVDSYRNAALKLFVAAEKLCQFGVILLVCKISEADPLHAFFVQAEDSRLIQRNGLHLSVATVFFLFLPTTDLDGLLV